MATNDFLVFGGGAGANVITQVTYSGLAARTAGFSAGVAHSAQLNKVWRQSSVMAAVLAQFIADITGQDALDDGTTAALLTNLKAGVRAQSIGVVGTMRNAKMSVTAASASATFTADEIVVESALGGLTYRLPSFNKTINLATTGAGGMDTGSAPNSGFVALYAIHNPTTGASALLAKNATSAVQPEVYGGANMPAGYTASALVSVWPTNGSGQLAIGAQLDRVVSINSVQVASGSTSATSGTPTALNIAAAVPMNARRVSGSGSITNPTANMNSIIMLSSLSGQATGLRQFSFNSATTGGQLQAFSGVQVLTAQTIYFAAYTSTASMSYTLHVSEYEF